MINRRACLLCLLVDRGDEPRRTRPVRSYEGDITLDPQPQLASRLAVVEVLFVPDFPDACCVCWSIVGTSRGAPGQSNRTKGTQPWTHNHNLDAKPSKPKFSSSRLAVVEVLFVPDFPVPDGASFAVWTGPSRRAYFWSSGRPCTPCRPPYLSAATWEGRWCSRRRKCPRNL